MDVLEGDGSKCNDTSSHELLREQGIYTQMLS